MAGIDLAAALEQRDNHLYPFPAETSPLVRLYFPAQNPEPLALAHRSHQMRFEPEALDHFFQIGTDLGDLGDGDGQATGVP